MIRFALIPSLLAALLVATMLSACADAPPAPRPTQVAAAGSASDAATPAPRPESFRDWLDGVYREGLAQGISAQTLDAALTGLTPLHRVIERDRHQPEFTQTFRQYLDARVTPARIAAGRERMKEYRALLQKVAARYDVQPRYIVALWGMESSFGRYTGGFSVVQALATLAYDDRRAAYFRRELFNALRIIDAGNVSADKMTGSWAGAMGQNQFMPSSYLDFAVDFDGDGRRDIWDTPADVFASSANYLAQSGWQGDIGWGRMVRVPPGLAANIGALMPSDPPGGCRALKELSVPKTLPEWQKMGVRSADGSDLPARPIAASLVMPDGADGPAMLVTRNFRTTLKWNCSILFATAVGVLAERLRD